MDARPADPKNAERLVLTGFMGSGKTTVGRLLAQRLGWRFADLDLAISREQGLSVPDIFALHGEAAFRAAEVATLRELLTWPMVVISLGGGAPETPGVRDLLRDAEHTIVIHLHAPFEVLFERCVLEAEDPASVSRPLLRERVATAARYERRLNLYAQVAQLRADVADRSPAEVVEQLLSILALELTHSAAEGKHLTRD